MSIKKKPLAAAIAASVALTALISFAVVAPGSSSAAPTVSATPPPTSILARQLQSGILPTLDPRRLIARRDVLAVHPTMAAGTSKPPTTAQCRRDFGAPCYSVIQLAHAYGADAAHRHKITGKRTTIGIVMPWVSPTLAQDVAKTLNAYGLPAPKLKIHTDPDVPPMPGRDDPTAPTRFGFAEESVFDVIAAYSNAPQATFEVWSVNGNAPGKLGALGPALKAMRTLATAHPGIIFSNSWGVWEDTTPLQKLLFNRINRQLAQISKLRATMIASNGDTGETDGLSSDSVAAFPASSPHVLAAAGTTMHLDDNGNRLPGKPDTVWSDDHNLGVATGGGISHLFKRPAYQHPIADATGQRVVADLTANASTDSRLVFWSRYNFLGGVLSDTGGWYRGAGTSEAAPLLAGSLALAAQVAHGPLGDVHHILYQGTATAAGRAVAGIADVTEGCNNVPGNPGHCASIGADPVSGTGTPENVYRFANWAGRSVIHTNHDHAARPAA